MVTKSTVALAAVAFTVTFVGVTTYLGGLPTLTQKLSEGVSAAKNIFQPVVNAWNGLPSSVRSIIMLGIPTLAATFFAWTKSRAMTKLQQTEQKAATQATQLTGDLSDAEHSARTTLQENIGLKTKLAVYEKDGDAVTALKTINTDLQAKIDGMQRQIDQVTTERNTIQREHEILLNKVTSDPYLKKLLQ